MPIQQDKIDNGNVKPGTGALSPDTAEQKVPFKLFQVKKEIFEIDPKYTPGKILGAGAYGVVICATNSKAKNDSTNQVAIKKVKDWSGDWVDGLRIVREVKLLRHFTKFKHPNLVGLYDLMASPIHKAFDEVYLVMEFMDTDMHKIIYSKNKLTDNHFQVWIHSCLKALKFMHSGNIIHRDLKPSNLLLNKQCHLKLCDFGLARGIGDEIDKDMTEYVVTRWYRAPELMCGCDYGEKIDVWALGCILGELLGKKPMLPGKDYKDQLKLIFALIGSPTEEDLSGISNRGAVSFMRKLPVTTKKDFSRHFSACTNRLCLDLLNKMLTFDQEKRISVEDALNHPWIRHLGTSDADKCPEPLSFAFEAGDSLPRLDRDALKQTMWDLVREIHPEYPVKRQMGQKKKQRSK